MEIWLLFSVVSSFLYAAWVLLAKSAQTTGTLHPVESQFVCTVTSLLFTFFQLYKNRNIARFSSMPVKGLVRAAGAGLATGVAGSFYNAALTDGPASSVAAVAGAYPAVAFVVNVLTEVEPLSPLKILGVFLSLASGLCFSFA